MRGLVILCTSFGAARWTLTNLGTCIGGNWRFEVTVDNEDFVFSEQRHARPIYHSLCHHLDAHSIGAQ